MIVTTKVKFLIKFKLSQILNCPITLTKNNITCSFPTQIGSGMIELSSSSKYSLFPISFR